MAKKQCLYSFSQQFQIQNSGGVSCQRGRRVSKEASYTQAILNVFREWVRPILMTASVDLAGFSVLLIASGAGANSRWSVGFAVFGGVLSAAWD